VHARVHLLIRSEIPTNPVPRARLFSRICSPLGFLKPRTCRCLPQVIQGLALRLHAANKKTYCRPQDFVSPIDLLHLYLGGGWRPTSLLYIFRLTFLLAHNFRFQIQTMALTHRPSLLERRAHFLLWEVNFPMLAAMAILPILSPPSIRLSTPRNFHLKYFDATSAQRTSHLAPKKMAYFFSKQPVVPIHSNLSLVLTSPAPRSILLANPVLSICLGCRTMLSRLRHSLRTTLVLRVPPLVQYLLNLKDATARPRSKISPIWLICLGVYLIITARSCWTRGHIFGCLLQLIHAFQRKLTWLIHLVG
jgi:hypothetical protein